MSENERKKGFDYFLAKETIEEYRSTPPELKLQWLYMGNQLRMGYDQKTIEKQDRFREGKELTASDKDVMQVAKIKGVELG